MQTRCEICNKVIGLTDRVVRVVAEVVERGNEQEREVDEFSKVISWEQFFVCHLSCVRDKIERFEEIQYYGEIKELPLWGEDLDDEKQVKKTILRVIK